MVENTNFFKQKKAAIDIIYENEKTIELEEKYYKKDRNFIIFLIVYAIIVFAVEWMLDSLMDRFFLVSYIPIFVLFVLFICCVVREGFVVLRGNEMLGRIGGIILAVIAVATLFFPFRAAKVRLDYLTRSDERLEVVNKIVSGEIDGSGKLINLPDKYNWLSSDGTVYVKQNNEEGVEVIFWQYRGMLSGSSEVIYSSGGEKMIRKNESSCPILRLKHLGKEWYYVETDY